MLDDVDECRRMLEFALPETDLFLPNCDEARLLTGHSSPEDQAEHFLQQGAQAVVITSGSDGAFYRRQEESSIVVPAFPVEQVDGTGGGDAFVSGYIYGMLKQSSPIECLTYGAAMGASCVQHAGATTGVFRRDELETFVAAAESSND